jgi:hypothetical protein
LRLGLESRERANCGAGSAFIHSSMSTAKSLFCVVAVFVTSAAGVDSGKIFTAEDFLQDRVPRCPVKNEPTSLLVQISPKLPPYQFVLIRESVAAPDGTIHHVGRIEISRPASEILQTVEVKSNWDDSVCRFFDAKDVNFDGYLDISVVREGAGTWASRDYYLFDPQSGRFISNGLTRDLGEVKDNALSVDWKTREIRASFMFSLCGGTDIYKIENGRLLRVQEDQVTVDRVANQCVETVRLRVNGEWKVVRVETTKLPRTGS